ncbi:ABC transporter ATP-binding protein [Altererythrobacter sp. ZODW24]|uniref:ABC transporter ATP-binding protein n=1 Tax=Altererythrobacter sp. ZODW24 TaxID=2185142 RepID=UPI000DF739A4|nr:ABC transporter ATP-binding protein [Altererythrobacter sp. ZODW24]
MIGSAGQSAPEAAMQNGFSAFLGTSLSKIYQTGETQVHALRGVDISIAPSEILVLLGPSGSGKSTLLNIIGGLDRPSAGDLWYGDLNLTDLSDRDLTRFRRAHVGFIFQFYNLIPSLTAEENVRLVTDIAEYPLDPADALEQVGLSHRLHHFPAQLSGGEQQRVAVARAIAKRPGVLFCDEPTGALDSATGVKVLETLANANALFGTTLIIITHNAGIAAMADRVLHFLDGQIVSIEENANRVAPADISW